MRLSSGLLEGQVLQRGRSGFATASIQGLAGTCGIVYYHATSQGSRAAGAKWQKAGLAAKGKWHAKIRLKTGGPYNLEFRINNHKPLLIKKIYAGDVWVLGGQSNMQGCGNRSGQAAPHPMVRYFSLADKWLKAKDPMHNYFEAHDTIFSHWPDRVEPEEVIKNRNNLKGVGPGLFFALERYKQTGVPQGLIPCAKGGSSMWEWSPSLLHKGGGCLLGAMLRRVKLLGQPVAGMLWYQGESDSGPESVGDYTGKMIELVASIRHHFKQPSLPWIIVQISKVYFGDLGPHWASIREQQRLLPGKIKHFTMVPSIDLQLDDAIHIGATGHKILGPRLAKAAALAAGPKSKGRKSIEVKSLKLVPNNFPGGPPNPEILFDNVKGSLTSQGLPSGFNLYWSNGYNQDPFKIRLEGKKIVLEADVNYDVPNAPAIFYGNGTSPYCNITDSEGMSLPAFGIIYSKKSKNGFVSYLK